jgi:NOL1/NOP2/fmu family ribosome biogenesis protein
MDVWDALLPGGFLIYSTCTFNATENEDTVSRFLHELGAELISISLPLSMQAGRNEIGNYCIPGITESEGFYIAVIQKPDASIGKNRFTRKNDFHWQKDLLDLSSFSNLENVTVFNWNDKLLALPKGQEDAMLHVQSQLRLQKMGTTLGEIARKGVIPNEELALNSFLLNYSGKIEVESQQALNYLHGDTFSLVGKQGFQLITFRQEPLGWVKHLGNRFNNLYPKEWRIRMNVD